MENKKWENKKCFKAKVCDKDKWPLGCPDTILSRIVDKCDQIHDLAVGDGGTALSALDLRSYAEMAADIKWLAFHLQNRVMRHCMFEGAVCELL